MHVVCHGNMSWKWRSVREGNNIRIKGKSNNEVSWQKRKI
jgi:hypothetical protein